MERLTATIAALVLFAGCAAPDMGHPKRLELERQRNCEVAIQAVPQQPGMPPAHSYCERVGR